MIDEVHKIKGRKWIELSEEELRMGFLTQCVEKLSEREGIDYREMFDRLEKAGLTEDYILKYYDVLHTESMDNIVVNLIDLLHKKEK